MKELTLENTHKALQDLKVAKAQYDRDCDYLLEEENGLTGREVNERFMEIFKTLELAEDEVRKAFYEDTKDRNCLDNCMIVSIGWLREMVDKYHNDKTVDAKDKAAVVPGHPSKCNCVYCNLPNSGRK
jgi:hypothetical protein